MRAQIESPELILSMQAAEPAFFRTAGEILLGLAVVFVRFEAIDIRHRGGAAYKRPSLAGLELGPSHWSL